MLEAADRIKGEGNSRKIRAMENNRERTGVGQKKTRSESYRRREQGWEFLVYK